MAAHWERWVKTRIRRGWHRFWDRLFRPPFDRAWIEEEVLDDLCTLAAGSHPKEMVAFLTGEIRKERVKEHDPNARSLDNRKEGQKSGKGTQRRKPVSERVLVINGLYVKGYYADHTSTHFTTHDLPLLDVYGTAHSHPSGNVHPSSADLQLFSRMGWFHLIVGRPYIRESIAMYDKQGRRLDRKEP